MRSQKQIALPKALFLLTLVTSVISGGTYFLLNQKRLKKGDFAGKGPSSASKIEVLVQTGPQKEALSSSYLAELLNLSRNKPSSFSGFNVKAAETRLLSSPVIKEAEVKFLPPNALYVSYMVRQPLAALYDVENGALDEEGVLFPLSPFFAPKTLPEIYLGVAKFVQPGKGFKFLWNQKLTSPSLKLAQDLLQLLSSAPYLDLFTVKRIDVSLAAEKSFGRREIILTLDEHFKEKRRIYLRLTPKNYAQELGNYLELRPQLAEEKKDDKSRAALVDLRISKLGFIQEL